MTFCNLFRSLESVELKSLTGPVTNDDFLAVASLPHLRSFATDLCGWDQIDFDSILLRSTFTALQNLTITAHHVALRRILPLFLPRIGAPSMISMAVLKSSPSYDTGTPGVETFTALSQCIATHWPTTLHTLRIQGVPCTPAEFSPIEGLTKIHTLELKQALEGSLSDARILTIVRTWSELSALTIQGAEADIDFMKCLAQHCPMLRTLHVGFFPHPLADISTTPVLAHALVELRLFQLPVPESRWNAVDLHLLARHLDRLFPRIESVTGDGSNHRWKEVAKLVSMCQDVRRTAWEQK
ncbi:hypothetical protein DFH06DRAFT_1334012 [Mycena polygramma]|nr:hypothetical protein DFH06DRAFT_1334012 [Mycena polygramma]